MNVVEGITDMIHPYGPAANLRILWDDMYITSSPEHMKLILTTGFNNHIKGMCLVSQSYRL